MMSDGEYLPPNAIQGFDQNTNPDAMMYGWSGRDRAMKRKRVTPARANIEKGAVAKSIKTSLEFNYAPLHDTLILISERNNINKVRMTIKGKGDKSRDIRWSKPAVLAVASILEMKIRKLLETSVIIMGSGSLTLTSSTLKKALLIEGDHHGMALKNGDDDLITKYAEEHGTITATRKREMLKKSRHDDREQWDKKNPEDIMRRAYQIFTPRVLDYLFAATNVQRASRGHIRQALARYSLNMLTNMMRHLHAILTFSRRCTVTVKDVDAANDQNGAPLLGFESIVKKRPNIRKSIQAQKSAESRAASNAASSAALNAASGGLPSPAQQFADILAREEAEEAEEEEEEEESERIPATPLQGNV
jgi:histone H3/H4